MQFVVKDSYKSHMKKCSSHRKRVSAHRMGLIFLFFLSNISLSMWRSKGSELSLVFITELKDK